MISTFSLIVLVAQAQTLATDFANEGMMVSNFCVHGMILNFSIMLTYDTN